MARFQVAWQRYVRSNSRETVLHLHLLHFLHKLLLLQRAELCLEVRIHLSEFLEKYLQSKRNKGGLMRTERKQSNTLQSVRRKVRYGSLYGVGCRQKQCLSFNFE